MEQFQRLLNIIIQLRSENGCPWDKEQTLESLVPDIIEETYEVVDAIESGDEEDLEEELGDLFFLVLFVSYIKEQEKRLTVENILKKVSDKLIRRHPHVFSNIKVKSIDNIIENWESIKLSEAKNQKRKTPFDGIPKGLPEIQRFKKIMDKIKLTGAEIKTVKKEELSASLSEFLIHEDIRGCEKFFEQFLTYCFLQPIDLSIQIRRICDRIIQEYIEGNKFLKINKENHKKNR